MSVYRTVLVLTADHKYEGDGYGSQDKDDDGRDDRDRDLHGPGEVHRDKKGSEETDEDIHRCDIEEPVGLVHGQQPVESEDGCEGSQEDEKEFGRVFHLIFYHLLIYFKLMTSPTF